MEGHHCRIIKIIKLNYVPTTKLMHVPIISNIVCRRFLWFHFVEERVTIFLISFDFNVMEIA